MSKRKIGLKILILLILSFPVIVAHASFTCDINGYFVEYENGKIISASRDGKNLNLHMESYFKPSSSSECPTEKEAKVQIIDSGRTFYVGTKAEYDKIHGADQPTYDNFDSDVKSCGNHYLTNIPAAFPKIVSILYILIQVAVPIILVITGSIDLVKGITAQKEDEIKKGQQMFIKRLIAAAIVFFVFVIVKFVISLAADSESTKILDCVECFIKNECD